MPLIGAGQRWPVVKRSGRLNCSAMTKLRSLANISPPWFVTTSPATVHGTAARPLSEALGAEVLDLIACSTKGRRQFGLKNKPAMVGADSDESYSRRGCVPGAAQHGPRAPQRATCCGPCRQWPRSRRVSLQFRSSSSHQRSKGASEFPSANCHDAECR